MTTKHEFLSSEKQKIKFIDILKLTSVWVAFERMLPVLKTRLRIVPENFLRFGFSVVLEFYLRIHDEEFDPGSG